MPSADFCVAVRSPCDDLSPESGRRSPEVRSTAFAARPPDLPPRSLMAVDFAITCSLVRPGRPRYPVLVHRAAALLHASFRRHLAMTPLRFAIRLDRGLPPPSCRSCSAHTPEQTLSQTGPSTLPQNFAPHVPRGYFSHVGLARPYLLLRKLSERLNVSELSSRGES